MPRPKGRPKGRRTDPPVSLSPLGPEEALAGLMAVTLESKTEEVGHTEEKKKPEEQQLDR